MNEERVTEIKLASIKELGVIRGRQVYIIGDVAYEVIQNTERRGFLAKFIDPNGESTGVFRLAVTDKLEKPFDRTA